MTETPAPTHRAPIRHRAAGGPIDGGHRMLLPYPAAAPTASIPVPHATRRALAARRRRERTAKVGVVLALLVGGCIVAGLLIAAVMMWAPGLLLWSVSW